MSLPYLFKTSEATIPRSVPYIFARENPEISGRLAAQSGEIKAGLVWAGNPKHGNDLNRSIPLESFAPLLESEGV
jgi:hypothetical protein